ncbi:MAG: alpha/beta hydrolase-fold protein [Acidobacteriota bacterium]|nr:alpha/beta hydrolase-fold protein [Acidobacteriota bacterium]
MKRKHLKEQSRAITRRKMLEILGFGAILTFTAGCRFSLQETEPQNNMTQNALQIKDLKASQEGRLLSRQSNPTKEALKAGQHTLPIEKKREVLLYVPKNYTPKNPAPFALMLHGAGGGAHHGLSLIQKFADETGIIILSPKSLDSTWDVIADNYGADVKFIDEALQYTFERCAIDKSRLAVGGFSDGASYALSLGLTNGDLFSHIIAYSPGFMAPSGQTGKPRIYVSHGTEDRVLPIEKCSRRIVPQLKRSGYDVLYKEFEGPHTIPPDIVRESVQWLTAK